jgi:hypothetical protein|tara:strand:- start:175 stop:327 length:153 start_codon:yes stop_codon:yes gene_type:complete
MSNFRVLSEFIATQSKPPAIAVEANIGPRRTPKKGNRTPAATGVPIWNQL